MLSLTIALCLIGLIYVFFLVALCRILYPIFFPTIIKYPYPPLPKGKPKQRRTVVFAGSFNPIHIGHLAMIQQYMTQHYSRVIIVIGTNPNKRYLVSAQERANLIRTVIRHSNNKTMIQNIVVQVVSDDYIWRIVQRQGATLFVRGIRTWEQDGRDEQRLQFQNIYGPLILGPLWYPIPTLFIQGIPKYNHISSTYLRNIIQQYSDSDPKIQHSAEEIEGEIEGEVTEGAIVPVLTARTARSQQQKEQLKQLLRAKLIAFVPESIVDDVIELYGTDTAGSGTVNAADIKQLMMQKLRATMH